MKSLKLTVTFSFLFLSFFYFSQSNTLVVFSQDPTPFYIVLDGVKKNEVAETRVVVPGIRQTNSNVQIYFKDESIAPITKNIWWEEGHENDEVTYRIVPVKRGYKLRFFSTVPNKVTPTPPPTTAVIVGNTVTAPVSLVGCVNPVQDIGSIMAAINDESFDEGKMTVAKQATSKKCLTVDQIKQIMDEFSFSKNKLEFAKYGYTRCYNPDDYYQVNAAFDFDSEKKELNEYIVSTPLAAAPVAVAPQATQNVQSTTTTVVTETTTINNNGDANSSNANTNNAVTNSNANVNGNMNAGINMNVNSGIDMNAGGTVNNSPDMVGGSISMNINMNDGTNMNTVNENMNMNMNVNVNDGNMNAVNPPNNGNMSINMNVNEGQANTAVPVNGQVNVNMTEGTNMNTGNENMNMNINMNGANMNAVNPPNNGNISINMNVNEGQTNTAVPVNGQVNVNMNMNDAGFNNAMNQANNNMEVNMNVNESVTSNTTNNAGTFNNNASATNIDVNETVTTTVTTTTTTINETPVAAPAPVSSGGCVNPVQDMGSIMAAIDDESFDEGKIIVAKQATSKKCLTVDQIKQILDEFSFSKNKLNFAKYAYKRCYNPDDYYQVNGAFDFSSDKEEMNEFINDQN